jgi:hypothetical protein
LGGGVFGGSLGASRGAAIGGGAGETGSVGRAGMWRLVGSAGTPITVGMLWTIGGSLFFVVPASSPHAASIASGRTDSFFAGSGGGFAEGGGTCGFTGGGFADWAGTGGGFLEGTAIGETTGGGFADAASLGASGVLGFTAIGAATYFGGGGGSSGPSCSATPSSSVCAATTNEGGGGRFPEAPFSAPSALSSNSGTSFAGFHRVQPLRHTRTLGASMPSDNALRRSSVRRSRCWPLGSAQRHSSLAIVP